MKTLYTFQSGTLSEMRTMDPERAQYISNRFGYTAEKTEIPEISDLDGIPINGKCFSLRQTLDGTFRIDTRPFYVKNVIIDCEAGIAPAVSLSNLEDILCIIYPKGQIGKYKTASGAKKMIKKLLN